MWTERTVDRESPQKLYVQIYAIVKEMIENGEWAANTHIPSEDELCRSFDVSKATVRLAISELVREGYLKRQQGRGTFVSTTARQVGMAMKARVTEDLCGEGVMVERELLEKGVREPSEDVRSRFKVTEALYFVQCKGLVDGEAVYVTEFFIPPGVLPTVDDDPFCRAPFFDIVQERATRKIYRMSQSIEVTTLRKAVAEILGVREHSPALVVHRTLIGSDGTPVAYMRLFGKTGRYRILTEFERIK